MIVTNDIDAALGYLHTQGVPSDTLVVAHNLGVFPSVTVIDSAGTQVEGCVTYDSENQVTITFNAPFSGTATFR